MLVLNLTLCYNGARRLKNGFSKKIADKKNFKSLDAGLYFFLNCFSFNTFFYARL